MMNNIKLKIAIFIALTRKRVFLPLRGYYDKKWISQIIHSDLECLILSFKSVYLIWPPTPTPQDTLNFWQDILAKHTGAPMGCDCVSSVTPFIHYSRCKWRPICDERFLLLSFRYSYLYQMKILITLNKNIIFLLGVGVNEDRFQAGKVYVFPCDFTNFY